MASEWFNTAVDAVRSGHRPVYDITYRPKWTLTVPSTLKQLREHHFSIVLSYHTSEAYRASEDFLRVLKDTMHEFGPWTSFRHDETVYFVFSRMIDAASFRMLWPI